MGKEPLALNLQWDYSRLQLKGRGWFGSAFDILYGIGLEKQNIILPTKKSERRRLDHLINRSVQEDRPLVVMSGTCPDYSHHSDPVSGSEVYDFEDLGTDIGLNTLTLFEKGAPFFGALQEAGVKRMHYLVGYADVEADDPEIIASVGLSKDEFVRRVEQSAEKALEVGSGIYGGVLAITKMSEFLLPEDYARAEMTMELIKGSAIDDIAMSRGNLYTRWFSKMLNMDAASRNEIEMLKKRRATEDIRKYLTFGFAARRMEAIILEATAPKITRLYNFGDGYSRDRGLKALPPAPAIIIEDDH